MPADFFYETSLICILDFISVTEKTLILLTKILSQSFIYLSVVRFNFAKQFKSLNYFNLSLNFNNVLVVDKDHLSVGGADVDTVLVTQFSEAVLPCRPTSPDVTVELTLITGEKVTLVEISYIFDKCCTKKCK
jgi:hypothetical protein